jgi:hypothetical protein
VNWPIAPLECIGRSRGWCEQKHCNHRGGRAHRSGSWRCGHASDARRHRRRLASGLRALRLGRRSHDRSRRSASGPTGPGTPPCGEQAGLSEPSALARLVRRLAHLRQPSDGRFSPVHKQPAADPRRVEPAPPTDRSAAASSAAASSTPSAAASSVAHVSAGGAAASSAAAAAASSPSVGQATTTTASSPAAGFQAATASTALTQTSGQAPRREWLGQRRGLRAPRRRSRPRLR